MVLFFILLRVLFIFKFLFYVNSFRFCTFHVPGFLGGVLGFLGVFRVFLGVFRIFGGCSGFLGCSKMFRDVPVFRCSVFRCSWKYYMPLDLRVKLTTQLVNASSNGFESCSCYVEHVKLYTDPAGNCIFKWV